MDISLIIPAHNEEKWIGQCLESVLRNPRNRFREIIVVDNASIDNTAKIAAGYPGVRVISEARKGLTIARQAGLTAASAEWIAYIDADCRLPDDWFQKAEKYVADSGTASVTGPIKYYDGPKLYRVLADVLQRITLPIARFIAGYLVIGGNFIARRDSLLKIGGFDQTIAFYGEDADIARRLSKEGKSLYKRDFFVYTSARRLMQDGIVRTYSRYVANFFSNMTFHRSLTNKYTDVRK